MTASDLLQGLVDFALLLFGVYTVVAFCACLVAFVAGLVQYAQDMKRRRQMRKTYPWPPKITSHRAIHLLNR